MTTETITWHPVESGLPDADMTVLVETIGCDEPVWLGSWDGERWRDTSGDAMGVRAWADMPAGSAMLQAAPPAPAPMDGDTLEDNVRYLLEQCPFTVRDKSGDRTGMRGREDLAGSLALTFLKMQGDAVAPPAPVATEDHIPTMPAEDAAMLWLASVRDDFRKMSDEANSTLQRRLVEMASAPVQPAPVADLVVTDAQIVNAFREWANSAGYDTAYNFDTERNRWHFFSAMTAALWKCWTAAQSDAGTRGEKT